MFGLAPDGTWGPYQTQAVPPSTVARPVCGPVTFWPPSAALASAAVTTLQEVGPAAGADAAELAAAGAAAGPGPGAGAFAPDPPPPTPALPCPPPPRSPPT